MSNGTREPLEPATNAFTGIWKLRRGWENSPNRIELLPRPAETVTELQTPTVA